MLGVLWCFAAAPRDGGVCLLTSPCEGACASTDCVCMMHVCQTVLHPYVCKFCKFWSSHERRLHDACWAPLQLAPALLPRVKPPLPPTVPAGQSTSRNAR